MCFTLYMRMDLYQCCICRSSQENWFQVIEMEGSWPSPENLLNLCL